MLRSLIISFCSVLIFNISLEASSSGLRAFESPTIREAKTLHDEAIEASRKDVEASERRLFELLQKEPKNELLRAFTGSLLTIKSGKSFPGPAALRIFKEGVQMMNDAVDNAPDDINVRLIRAINHYELPAFFNRRQQARTDFKWLLDAIKKSDCKNVCDTTRGIIYYYAGLSYQQTGEKDTAQETWRLGLEQVKDRDWRIKIAERLGKSTASSYSE